jgi:hypothetical protein
MTTTLARRNAGESFRKVKNAFWIKEWIGCRTAMRSCCHGKTFYFSMVAKSWIVGNISPIARVCSSTTEKAGSTWFLASLCDTVCPSPMSERNGWKKHLPLRFGNELEEKRNRNALASRQ